MKSRSKKNASHKVGKNLTPFNLVKLPRKIVEEDNKHRNRTDWVYWFNEDNIFPQTLINEANKSTLQSTILRNKINYTIGKGFTVIRDGEQVEPDGRLRDFLDNPNVNDESLFDIYIRCVTDFIYTGNYSLEFVPFTGGFNVFHKDVSMVRLGKRNDEGVIESAHLSESWDEIKREMPRGENKVKELPLFNKERLIQSIIFRKQYTPSKFYYGLPDWLGAYLGGWVLLDYLIPRFNTVRFKKGFMPSALIQLFGEPPEGQSPEQFAEDIKDSFTDEDEWHKIFIQLLESREQAANVQLLDQIRDGEFTELQKLTTDQLISGNQWFPSLSGISTAGELGSTQRIKNEYQIALETTIRKYRTFTLGTFNKLLEMAGFAERLSIINIDPISVVNEITADSIITVEEARAASGLAPLGDERDQQLLKQIRGGV